MWAITEAEAVEMYARHFVARHNATAARRAREKADSLNLKGDARGHKIWNEVADAIDRHNQQDRHNLKKMSR
jgi:hypothetical protein